MNYDTPSTFKPGCLPRASRPGEVCQLFSDRIKVIPRSEWPQHIGKVSLRPFVYVVFDQDGKGSCAFEATLQALQIALKQSGKHAPILNPWPGYYAVTGGRDRGSNIDGNLTYVMENGAPSQDVWPRYKDGEISASEVAHRWNESLSQEAKDDAKKYRIAEFFDITTVEEFGTALLLGMPVVYGRRGHALCAVELVSETEFRYVNSWNQSWGDGGFAVESLYGVNFGYGAWAVRATTEA